MRMRIVLASVFAAVAMTHSVRATPALPKIISEGPAVRAAAVRYVIHSDRVGRDFVIDVTPPFSPMTAGEKRPVIYALDGGYDVNRRRILALTHF